MTKESRLREAGSDCILCEEIRKERKLPKMKCCWCGGEILNCVRYQAPSVRTAYMELIRIEMNEKRFCTESCLRKHLTSFSNDLAGQIGNDQKVAFSF